MIVFNQVNYRKIQGLSFQIERGEIVLIFTQDEECLGEMRGLLTGKIKPDSGFVRLADDPSNLQSEMGIVYREDLLLPDRSLAENLYFIMGVRGVKRPYREARLNRILLNLELENELESFPGQLSPYQLLKANIAQALVYYPAFLILEDPVRELDEVSSQALLHLLEELNRLSLTIIVLCSDPGFIRRSHQRIIELEKGQAAKRKKGSYA